MNEASGGDGIPVELFQILKDDALKVLHSICQQIWKTQQWPQDWKRSVFIPIPKKGNAKECSTKAMFRKSLIQFSADGWGCVPSLQFGLRPNYGRSNGDLLPKGFCQHAVTPRPLQSVSLTLHLQQVLWKKTYDKATQCIKKQRHHFAEVQSKLWFFQQSCESCWTIKSEYRTIDAFKLWCWRRLLESPLNSKEIQPVHPKGNQTWILIGRTGAEAEALTLQPPDVKN